MNLQSRIITNFIACVARNEEKKVTLKMEEVAGFHYTLDINVSDYHIDSINKLVSLGQQYTCYLTHELLQSGKKLSTLRIHFQLED